MVAMSRYGVISLMVLLGGVLLSAQDFQVQTRVDLVVVPVSARDGDRIVGGLSKDDFSIFEDGKPQEISNFSADPQPLSAAIVIDTGMGGGPMRKIAPLFVALTSGFSEFDEMAAFRFDHLVFKLNDFTNDPVAIEKSFEIVNTIAENRPNKGTPGEPMAAASGLLKEILSRLKIGSNGKPSEGPAQPTIVPGSRVLHDAVFEAALALEARPKDHRKIILLVSDGQVSGYTHSMQETTERLLKSQIQVYAVGLDFSVLEGRFGVLSSYARATGGALYNSVTTNGIESAFNRITEQARNQYVLGYMSNNEVPGLEPVFRTIEVRSRNPKLTVTHRKGYLQFP